MADEMLAAISGATQGASKGLSLGIQNATGIKQFQNAEQEGAIRQEAFQKYQKEEAENSKPIYKNTVFEKVPAWARPTYERELQPYWKQGAQGSEPFIEAGKLKEVNKTLNTGVLGRYRMMQEGMGWITEQQQPLRQKIDSLKSTFGPIMEQRKKAIADAEKAGDAEKAFKLKSQLQKDMTDPKSEYYKPLQEYYGSVKAYDALQGQMAMLQGKSNQANGMIDKLKQETLLDEKTIIDALEGDQEAAAKVQNARRMSKMRGGSNMVNVRMADGSIIIADKQDIADEPEKYEGAEIVGVDRRIKPKENDQEKIDKKESDRAAKKLDGIAKIYDSKIKELKKNNAGDAEIADWQAQRDELSKTKDYVLRGGNPRKINWQGMAKPQSKHPKALDANTAKSYLQKAGGDKDKARKLAKDDGYQF